jgi:hypothetical protein
MSEQRTGDPHPWYGPCDALASYGSYGWCAECLKSAPEIQRLQTESFSLRQEDKRLIHEVLRIEARMREVNARLSELNAPIRPEGWNGD